MNQMPSVVEARLTPIINRFGNAGLSPGDRAELRRMDPAGPALPPAFWQLSAVDAAPHGEDAERLDRALAIVIQALAETGGTGERSIGAALAESNYAEQRFVRLLRARGLKPVAHEARMAAQCCARNGFRLRWTDRYGGGFGPFIVAAALEQPRADGHGHAIARDYYSRPREERDVIRTELQP